MELRKRLSNQKECKSYFEHQNIVILIQSGLRASYEKMSQVLVFVVMFRNVY